MRTRFQFQAEEGHIRLMNSYCIRETDDTLHFLSASVRNPLQYSSPMRRGLSWCRTLPAHIVHSANIDARGREKPSWTRRRVWVWVLHGCTRGEAAKVLCKLLLFDQFLHLEVESRVHHV